MRELLHTIAEHLVFLLESGRYRLSDSFVGETHGDAWVALEGQSLTWRVVRDRSQVFLECHERGAEDDKWYSTDLLVRLLDERRMESAELTGEVAQWLQANLSEVEARFRADAVSRTVAQLRELKRLRAKELFG